MMIAIRLILSLTVICGLIYPLAMTGAAKLLFPKQAKGSLIVGEGRVVGSELIGRQFDDPRYFWSRPSATAPFPYNAAASSGSNYGPLNPNRQKVMDTRRDTLRAADPGNNAPVPIDLLTASGSGLDPHISVAAAQYQLPRVARLRGVPEDRIRALVAANTAGRTFGVLGEPRVNVLALNLALDRAVK